MVGADSNDHAVDTQHLLQETILADKHHIIITGTFPRVYREFQSTKIMMCFHVEECSAELTQNS